MTYKNATATAEDEKQSSSSSSSTHAEARALHELAQHGTSNSAKGQHEDAEQAQHGASDCAKGQHEDAEQAQHGANDSAKGQHEDAEQAQHGASDGNGERAEGQQQEAAAQQQQELHEEGEGLTLPEAGVRRQQTEKQKNWTSRQTKQAGQVVSDPAAADGRTEQAVNVAAAAGVHQDQTGSMGRMQKIAQTKQKAPGKAKPQADAKNAECDAAAAGVQTADSRVPAAIQRKTPLSWSGAISTAVLFMMMTTTAGAAEHGQAQKMTSSQQMQWASKLGEIQKTIDQVAELKRRDRWDQHTEAAEAQRIRTDRDEATLQILGEFNLNMRSEMEKRGAKVDLGRQMQFMRRLLDAEQQKEQPAQVMRQESQRIQATSRSTGRRTSTGEKRT